MVYHMQIGILSTINFRICDIQINDVQSAVDGNRPEKKLKIL